ncbi:hypothetical protein [Roseomonas sp. WA12]
MPLSTNTSFYREIGPTPSEGLELEAIIEKANFDAAEVAASATSVAQDRQSVEQAKVATVASADAAVIALGQVNAAAAPLISAAASATSFESRVASAEQIVAAVPAKMAPALDDLVLEFIGKLAGSGIDAVIGGIRDGGLRLDVAGMSLHLVGEKGRIYANSDPSVYAEFDAGLLTSGRRVGFKNGVELGYSDVPGAVLELAGELYSTAIGIDPTNGVLQVLGFPSLGTGSATPGSRQPGDLSPVYGGHLHLLPGARLPLFPRMLFANRADDDFARVTFSSGGYGVGGRECIEIDPARCGGSGALTITRADVSSNDRIAVPLNVRVATPAGQTPRVLTIGDSIANRGLLTLMKTRLNGLGISPSFVGTVRSSATTTSTGTTGELGESREGRAYADLVYSILDGEAQPLPVGQEATYLALAKSAQLAYNPFLRVATGGDTADVIRNGYVFDLSFYLTRFGFAIPDILLVGLLENDAIEQADDVVGPTVGDAVRIVLAQARRVSPTMRIGLFASGQASCSAGDARWTNRKAPGLRALIEAVRSINDPLVSVISAWAHQTPDAGWALDAPVTNPATGVSTGPIADFTHPISPAREQLAEAVAAYVAWAA